MKCLSCKTNIKKKASFCPKCGKKVEKKKPLKIYIGVFLFLSVFLFLFYSLNKKNRSRN